MTDPVRRLVVQYPWLASFFWCVVRNQYDQRFDVYAVVSDQNEHGGYRIDRLISTGLAESVASYIAKHHNDSIIATNDLVTLANKGLEGRHDPRR